MLELGDDARLVLEALRLGLVGAGRRPHHLHRHLAVERLLHRQVDDRHAALAQAPHEPVADHGGQWRLGWCGGRVRLAGVDVGLFGHVGLAVAAVAGPAGRNAVQNSPPHPLPAAGSAEP
jgi:hypothetical protein